jgi:hypothetical protein
VWLSKAMRKIPAMKLYRLLFVALYLMANASCVKNSDYVLNDGLQADSMIRFVSITPLPADADSFSKIIVRIAINKYADDNAEVTLNTDQGLINGSSKSETMAVNLSRYADFIITTGRSAGPVKLKATVSDSLIRDTIIYFAKAYPDSILVQPQQQIADKNTNVSVDIGLFRKTGYPSMQQAILCQATDSLGNKTGSFSSISDFIPGRNIQTTFTPSTDFTGKTVLHVFIIKEDGSRLEGSTTVVFRQ